MTVLSSLYSGISGIVSNGSALSVAGDNIANMSTPAFKASVPIFESALSQRIGEAEVGLGARLGGTSANFSQGAFANTTRSTDMAIQGKGFFVVRDTSGGQYYTRAGMFQQDSDGQLVTSTGGFVLQGYPIDANGLVSGTLGAVNFSTVSSNPVRTSNIDFAVNLNGAATTPATNAWDSAANAAASSNYSYSQTLYDNLGNPRTVTSYFRKTGVNTWDYRTMTAASNLTNASALTDQTAPIAIDQGTMVFDTAGRLVSQTPLVAGDENVGNTFPAGAVPTGGYKVTTGGGTVLNRGVRWTGATPAMGTAFSVASSAAADATVSVATIIHDFGDVGTSSATTQFSAATSAVKIVAQNGRSQGELQSVEVIQDGTVRGNFSNGDARDLYKIPIATFTNENGLSRLGSNLFSETGTSGTAAVGLANAAGRGQIRSFSTEQSNVDLASEFVKMITFQRAFQASSRTVTTASELMESLVQLGR